MTTTFVSTTYEEWASAGVYPNTYCAHKTSVTNGSMALPKSGYDLKSPTIQGDRIKALPYNRKIVDGYTVAGRLDIKHVSRFNAPAPCRPQSSVQASCSGFVDAGFLAPLVSVPSLVMDAADLNYVQGVAVTKALADARRSYNNLPLLIAERRETIVMIARRVSQLVRMGSVAQREAIKRYTRTRRSQKEQIARDIARSHLELLFGWLPLIGEIEGLIDQLAEAESTVITGRGRMRLEKSTTGSWVAANKKVGINDGKNAIDCRFQHRADTLTDLSARASVRYKITLQAFQTIRDNGFNPLATAYDLVPMSFLASFVSNVDHWLRAYDPMIGAEYETGSCMNLLKATNKRLVKGARVVTSSWIYETVGSGELSQEGRHYNRVVFATPPSPSFHFVNRLTPGKVATAAALVLSRKIKPFKRLLRNPEHQFRYRGPRPRYLPPIGYRPPRGPTVVK